MSEKPRPSALPHLEICPRWVGRPKTAPKNSMDEAAEEGTFLHAKCEELSQTPVTGWLDAVAADPSLSPAQMPVVVEALSQVRDLFGLGLPVTAADGHYELATDAPDGVYLEVGVDPKVVRPGTADLLAVCGTRAWLCDYKFTRVERTHSAQMSAYIIGVFEALSRVEYVELRIVAPRLWGANEPLTFSRAEDLPRLREEVSAIVERAADPFSPGCPGEPCATCHGNGRCPYQAASLRDIPVDETGIVMPAAWLPVISAATPECRGQRRKLLQWLDKFVEAGKEDDKRWALENPDATLPGFTKSVALGRLSLDKDRLGEANMMLATAYNLAPQTLLGLAVVDRDRAAEIVGLMKGISQDAAKADINKTLAPYMKRGQDIISFRAEKRAKLKAAEPKEIGGANAGE